MHRTLFLASLLAATPALAQPAAAPEVHKEHADLHAAIKENKAVLADINAKLDRIEGKLNEHRKHEKN